MNTPAIDWLIATRLFQAGRVGEARAAAERLLAEESVRAYALHLLGQMAAAAGDRDTAIARISEAIALDDSAASFHHDIGNLQQDAGRLDRAISEYRKALRIRADRAETLNDLGTAYHAKGWNEEATECYRRAIASDSRHIVAHANLGATLRRLGRYREARRALATELRLRLAGAIAPIGSALRIGRRSAPERPGAGEIEAAARDSFSAGDAGVAELLAREQLDRIPNHVPTILLLVEVLKSLARSAEAIALAREAVRLAPQDARARVVLGELLSKHTHSEEAVSELSEAVRIDSSLLAARLVLGSVLLDRGEFRAALNQFRDAVRIDRASVEAWIGVGRAHAKAGDTAQAESAMRFALGIDPDSVQAIASLGTLLVNARRLSEAEAILGRLRQIAPDEPGALTSLALLQRATGQFRAAVETLLEAIRIDPDDAGAHNNLGLVYTDLAERDSAILHLKEAERLSPGQYDALLNLARVYHFEGDAQESEAVLVRALALYPRDAALCNSLGMVHVARRQHREAVGLFRKSLEFDPDYSAAKTNLANTLVEMGELREGWDIYESRIEDPENRGAHQRFSLPRWDGGALDRRCILVYPEQGLGDQIMFASCVPDLMARGGRVALECADKLAAIFARSFPQADVRTFHTGSEVENLARFGIRPDVQVAMGSLPHFFRNSFADFPARRGFLAADPAKIARWRDRIAAFGPGTKIGISWKGGLYRTGENRRTLTLDRLLPILRVRDATFVSLQYTECQQDLDSLRQMHGITVHHWQDAIDDYDETAALVCALDRVVTVCTAIVHLAGGLGRPVLVMAPFSPGWRYAMQEGGMPWYPSVRVFRQRAAGEWDPVIDAVRAELAA